MNRKTIGVIFAGLLSLGHIEASYGQVFPPALKHGGLTVPREKQTVLGLYATSQEAYAMWQKNPEAIKILDCRTPEEYVFVGHPAMACNIPVKFMRYTWDAATNNYLMRDNPDFVSEVHKRFNVTDTILIICRFGGRSAASVNKLAEAGFKKVYNITDGFEGGPVQDSKGYSEGKHGKRGWKNSGAPWTYQLDAKLIYLPLQEKGRPTQGGE